MSAAEIVCPSCEAGQHDRCQNDEQEGQICHCTDRACNPFEATKREMAAAGLVTCDGCPDYPHPLNDDGTKCKRPRPARSAQ